VVKLYFNGGAQLSTIYCSTSSTRSNQYVIPSYSAGTSRK
jgi:hypothetical protein